MEGSHSGIAGRRHELEAIEQLLDREGPGVAALLLDGEAGIGKTTIWEWGLGAARERSLLVLSSQPAETEASLPFVVLGDLLEPVLDDVLPVLAEPQRLALEAALSLVEPAEPLERLTIARAVLSAFRELAGRGPVVVALDDVQWIDPASAGALEFATRRMTDLPVRLLLARRSDRDAAAPAWLAQGLASYDVRADRVEPLEPNELDTVLRVQLGLQLPRTRLGELHRASGGNPFYALEIAAAGRRRGTLTGKAPLQVPGTLGDLLRERLAELSPDALAAVLLVAASSQAPASVVEQAAGGREGLDEAVQRAVLEVDGERLRFTHPLLSSVAYGLAEPGERRRAHLSLAEATADPEERARQLALGADGPDETVAALLEAAGRAAGARGGSEAAAELYELAAGLTPDDLQDRRHGRRFQAARHEILAGEIARAAAVLHELVGLLPAGPERAEALVCLADFEDDPAAGRDLCLQALEEARGQTRLRAEAGRMLAEFLMTLGELDSALEQARLAASLAEECGDETLLVQTLGIVAHFETYTAEITDGLLEHAVELEEAAARPSAHYSPHQILALRLMYADRLDEARERLELALTRARQAGDEFECRNILNHLTQLEIRAGNWARANEHATETDELVRRLGVNQIVAAFTRALVDAHLGRLEEAADVVRQGLAIPESILSLLLRWVLGFVELSRGDAGAAADLLVPDAEKLLAMGYRNPGVRPVLPDAIEAALADGRLDEARKLVVALEQGARVLDNPWALATAGRCRGMLLAGEGDLPAAVEALEHALVAHERASSPFELARTQLVYGATLRRVKRRADARAVLVQALELFDAVGAPRWAEKAAAELARIPGRGPASGELTETEQRVAELVAEGLSNKEVAARLFVSVRAVEANLSKIYAKLGIRSRTQLAGRLKT